MKYELNLIEREEKGKARGIKIGRAEGEARGIKIGEARGEANATSRIVKGLRTLGLSDTDIAKGVSIPVEQVHNILKS